MCQVLMKNVPHHLYPGCLHTVSLWCGLVCVILAALLPFNTISNLISAGILLGEHGSLP